MIPRFPEFKVLDLHDKEIIDSYNRKYPRYSDFNFSDLWSYNVDQDTELSILNDNLVVKMADYVDNKVILTFLGNNNSNDTVEELLKLVKRNPQYELGLIPEISICKLMNKNNSNINIIPDEDGYDYMFEVGDFLNLAGPANKAKRNLLTRFEKEYPKSSLEQLNLLKEETIKDINILFYEWAENKGIKKLKIDKLTEYIALNQFIAIADRLRILAMGLYINNKMIGFSICEFIANDYAIIHFEKANIKFKGVYQKLKLSTVESLKTYGVKKINYEQDLGLEGLRFAKNNMNPSNFNKKYKIVHA